MTIKWVKVDPLVMNGEPFCYGSRVTVRELLELRAAGQTPTAIVKDHPELKPLGIAFAYRYAAADPDRFGGFLDKKGALVGPGFSEAEAAALAQQTAHASGPPRRGPL